MTAYNANLFVHIVAGTIALAAFWTAATLRKGSGAHRVVGRTFLIAMAAVAATGVGIAIAAFSRGQPVFGTFLVYLVLITASACWVAWRAVRDKHDFNHFTGPVYRTLAWAQIGMGVVVLFLGVRYEQVLIAALSAVGLIAGTVSLKLARRPPTSHQWWIPRHYGSIVGAGVGTHVAFLNIGLARLLPADLGGIAQGMSWSAPFVLAFAARWWLDRKYGPRRPNTTQGTPIAPATAAAEKAS